MFVALDCQDLLVQIHSVSVHGLDVGASSAARTVLEAPGPRGRSGEPELGIRESPGPRGKSGEHKLGIKISPGPRWRSKERPPWS